MSDRRLRPIRSDLGQNVLPPAPVFVTGAGFTRAFVPNAPLLVDDFDNDSLVDRVRGLPNASRLLEWERNQHPDGLINIERLMTRLDQLMPYDLNQNAADEYRLLLTELKRAFLNRLSGARRRHFSRRHFDAFANHCATNQFDCVTFNYDDFLDEALKRTGRWTPEWGYGFFCRTSLDAVSDVPHRPPLSGPRLLRLHGCVNWRPRLGHSEPFALDSIVHHHEWEGDWGARYPLSLVAQHLETEPVIVPPVLSKSSLLTEPVLRLVWTLAFETLTTAKEVTFIGYSFPSTDLAARTLFSEALRDLPRENIRVVDLATEEADIVRFKTRYRSVLGEIPDHRFSFDGAVPWIRTLADQATDPQARTPSDPAI